MKNIFTSFFIFITTLSFWQSVITVTVIDGEFNVPLPFANVILKNAANESFIEGITTDFDGKFLFEVVDGTYLIELSYVGYETQQITEINITGDKEFLIDVILNPSSNSLDEVVVTTSQRKNSEVAILAIQKKLLILLTDFLLRQSKKPVIVI